MRSLWICGALALTLVSQIVPANAKGCLKGAAVGAVAGHLAGHGVAGAAAGCVIGHHEANKNQKSTQGEDSNQGK